MTRRIVLLLSLVVPLLVQSLFAAAPSLGSVALLVHETDEAVLDERLEKALASGDASVRAAAARVAIVRNRKTILPRVESMLATDSSPEVTRELIRAAMILGGEGEFERVVAASKRFDHRLDESILVAVARLGGATAIPLYLKNRASLEEKPGENFFLLALWQDVGRVVPTSARLVANGDEEVWGGFLSALKSSSITLESGIAQAVLQHPDAAMRRRTIDFLLHALLNPEANVPADLKTYLRDGPNNPADPVGVEFRRELIRRMLGREAASKREMVEWIATPEGSHAVRSYGKAIGKFLTSEEKGALLPDKDHEERGKTPKMTRSVPAQRLHAPPFYGGTLPSGVTAAILAESRCSAAYAGLGSMVVDRAGRVVQIDTSKIYADKRCQVAMRTLSQLALVHNSSILSPFDNPYSVFLKPANEQLCLDEAPVPLSHGGSFEACAPTWVDEDDPMGCEPPRVKKRIDPWFPEQALRAMAPGSVQVVVIEALITESGCVRDARLVQQSDYADLNTAALLAVLKWRFEAGKRVGVPVPVLFNLTVNFRR
jgi:TonB family protein